MSLTFFFGTSPLGVLLAAQLPSSVASLFRSHSLICSSTLPSLKLSSNLQNDFQHRWPGGVVVFATSIRRTATTVVVAYLITPTVFAVV